MPFFPIRVALIALVVALIGCSGSVEFSVGGQSVEDAATSLIEGELSEQLGVELTANCPEVEDPEIGTEFECTATTPDGMVVRFAGVVDREDHIDVQSTNVLFADALPEVEVAGAEALSAELGVAIVIECGTETVVLDQNNEMECFGEAGGSSGGVVYTIEDTRTGDFNVRLAE